MKPIQNTKDRVRHSKLTVPTDARLDQRVLDDSFAAMQETLGVQKPNTYRMVLRHWAARVSAAAAIVVVCITVFQATRKTKELPSVPVPPPSPTRMLSMLSLTRAYQRGGIEAVDHQTQQAFDQLGTQSTGVSLHELLNESNGV
jgi:hypothetical protein